MHGCMHGLQQKGYAYIRTMHAYIHEMRVQLEIYTLKFVYVGFSSVQQQKNEKKEYTFLFAFKIKFIKFKYERNNKALTWITSARFCACVCACMCVCVCMQEDIIVRTIYMHES